MNIAEEFKTQARIRRHKTALKVPVKNCLGQTYDYDYYSFLELDRDSDHLGFAFQGEGLNRGDKVLVFLKPGWEFAATVFALFKMGAIPVFIDPGMGRKNLLKAISEVKPKGLIGEPVVHFLKYPFKSSFQSVQIEISSGFVPGVPTLDQLLQEARKCHILLPTAHFSPDELAAILYTSGGTGPAKGVEYTHKIFCEQTKNLQQMFGLTPRDIDVPAFPLFSFFTLSMGMTSCPPDMNPSKPAKCSPESLVKNIQDNRASFIAGSPAIWERVADYCEKEGIILDTVKHLVMFGAPVSPKLLKKLKPLLPNGESYTPYGATESLPVSLASGTEILNILDTKDTKTPQGLYIGKPVSGVEVKILSPIDSYEGEFPTALDEISEVRDNCVGEIVVKSKTTTQSYFRRPMANKKSKIWDAKNQVYWHRMGDLGLIDENGALWYMGRTAHALKRQRGLLCSFSSELPFNLMPEVHRSAMIHLTGTQRSKAGMVIELNKGQNWNRDLEEKVDQILSHPDYEEVEQLYLCSNFPVDIRHNIKIDRPLLGQWAKKRKLKELPLRRRKR